MSGFHIAIDGPVAAGKGTVSKLVADQLGFLFVDTGAMYRMTALLAQRQGVSLDDVERLIPLIQSANMDMHSPQADEDDGRLATILLNGEDVTWKIRTEAVSAGSSQVAKHPQVRQQLVAKQQQIAEGKNVVMEGRDITYRVLPQAQLKIYLTASNLDRATRRLTQLQAQGVTTSLDEVSQDLQSRDQADMERAVDPLRIVDDAWVIDSSSLSIDQVVELIVNRVKSLRS